MAVPTAIHFFLRVARLARAEVFDPGEVAVLHICARVVRRCFLFGFDPVTGKNHLQRSRKARDDS